MNENFFQFERTYRNCCGFPHWIVSVCICTICMTFYTVFLILSIFFPKIMIYLYKVTDFPYKVIICGCIICGILILSGIVLACGIAKDHSLSLLLWVIINTMAWNLHLILFMSTFAYYIIAKMDGKIDVYGPFRLFILFLIQVIWMICLVMVGQHWYALCEDIFFFENGEETRGQSTRRRIMAASIRRWL